MKFSSNIFRDGGGPKNSKPSISPIPYKIIDSKFFPGNPEKEMIDLMKKVIELKGGTPEDYFDILDMMGFVESAGTMDPTIKQKGRKPGTFGPGRGTYQLEAGPDQGAWSRLQRMYNMYQIYPDMIMPRWTEELYNRLKGTKNLDVVKEGLTRRQQDMLVLSDFLMKKGADLSKLINGEQDVVDFWADYHWSGRPEERQKKVDHFNELMPYYNKWKNSDNYRNYSRYNRLGFRDLSNLRKNTVPEVSLLNEFGNREDLRIDSKRYRDLYEQGSIHQNKEGTPQINLDEVVIPVNNKKESFLSNLFQQGGNSDLFSYLNNKKLTQYNEGGSHETNPLGGIPIGMGRNGKMNKVEQGETSFKIRGNKFIFSDKLFVDSNNFRSPKNKYNIKN